MLKEDKTHRLGKLPDFNPYFVVAKAKRTVRGGEMILGVLEGDLVILFERTTLSGKITLITLVTLI